MKFVMPVLLCILALSMAACAKTFDSYGGKTGYGPQAETPTVTSPVAATPPVPQEVPPADGRVRGNVYLESTDILLLESYPVQVRLHATGSLPTPCHALASTVTMSATAVNVELYSLVDPEVICVQMLQPFDETIALGAFATADSDVIVNGQVVGRIELR